MDVDVGWMWCVCGECDLWFYLRNGMPFVTPELLKTNQQKSLFTIEFSARSHFLKKKDGIYFKTLVAGLENLVLRGLEGDRCFYKHAQNKTKDKLSPRINQTLPLSRHPTLGSPASQSRLERFQLCGPQMFHRRSGRPMRQPRGYAVPTLGVLAPAAHC